MRPPFGRAERPVRKFLTAGERRTIAAIEAMIRRIPVVPPLTSSRASTAWLVEPAVSASPMYALQRRVLSSLEGIVDASGGLREDWPLTYVSARTQDFIRQSLAEVGCAPALARTSGTVLMGASVCGRRVVVSNLTGYLHLTSADQAISSEMESRQEVPLRRMPHRLVVRASGGLAHEFVHTWRAAAVDGEVRSDEPAWFAEGLAEFWAGVATVRALAPRLTYTAQHVLRARDFADWRTACPGSLSAYRQPSSLAAGCEYHVGLLAVELLLTRHSDLTGAAGALARAPLFATSSEWFADAFGVGLTEFEREADAHIAAIRRAG